MNYRTCLIALCAMVAALFAMPAFSQTFPAANGKWVIDQADILPPAEEASLNSKLEAFEKANGHQLIVVTIASLEGYDVADYGYRAARFYNPGDAKTDDGVMLLVAPNDRRVHIAVGYGMEPILTDAYFSVIINSAITPRFKAGDMPGGIDKGVDAIIQQISLPPEQARARAEAAQAQLANRSNGDGSAAIFWIIIFLFFILPVILRMLRGNRGRRYRDGGNGPVIIWGPGFGSGYGGGGFSGGGGFGGGFSGGGGGFGGGGASGSW